MSESHQKFLTLIQKAPRIAKHWNFVFCEVSKESFAEDFAVMSSGERTLAAFFYNLWTRNNEYNFDLVGQYQNLDEQGRAIIIEWLNAPFWP